MRYPFRKVLLFLSILAAHDFVEVSGQNWPQWRGPRGDSIVDGKIATTWSPTENIHWRTPLPGQGGATPVLWNDRIFLTSAEGDDLVLLCIKKSDGSVLWKRTVTSGNQNARAGEGNSASPSPSTDGTHVWVFFSTGVLACYDFEGNEVWKFQVGDRFGKIDIQFGMSSTPFLFGDHLYLQLIHGVMRRDDQTRTGKVVKLDKKTGRTVWEIDRVTDAEFECKHSYASPFVYDADGLQFLVVHGADCTTGHALDTGRELWRLGDLNGPSHLNAGKKDGTFRFVASPSVVQGTIIVPTAKSGPTVALKVSDALRGNVSTNKDVVRWSFPKTPDVAIPLVKDGLVYYLHNDGRLQCIDLTNGEEVYLERTHTAQHRASPLFAGGNLYLCNRDGFCTVVKGGRKFEIIAKNDLKEPITASPIVSDGILYLRTYDALYAIR